MTRPRDSLLKNYPDILTAKEVQEILRIGYSSTCRLLSNSTIKNFRIGKQYLVPKANLIQYIKQHIKKGALSYYRADTLMDKENH